MVCFSERHVGSVGRSKGLVVLDETHAPNEDTPPIYPLYLQTPECMQASLPQRMA